MAEPALHIVALEVENVKRLRAVKVRPDGSLVIVGGRNAQGKTSLLDAIEMALGGAKAIPPDPIRHGARKARSVIDLGEIRIERSFSQKGSALVVTTADGAPVKSPQALLDSLCAAVTFDPLAFARMDPKKQDEVLKRLLGLDFTELDRERAELFTARTQANRDWKALDARLDAMPEPPAGLPAKEVSVAELVEELDRRRGVLSFNAEQRRAVEILEAQAAQLDATGAEVEEEIARLKAELAKAQNRLSGLSDQRALKAREITDATAAVEQLVDPDLDEVRLQIALSEETNVKVRAAAERKRLEAELAAHEERSKVLSDTIAAIDEKKRTAIGSAKFPVEGLGFDDVGPTLNGVPLEQASGAEKLRLSVAIGAALNPRVRVMLVRDGSLLDSDSLKLLAELAAETGSQVWLERVSSDGAGCSVVIEDGMVREDAPSVGAAE